MRETTASRLNQLMKERNLKQVDILNKSKPYQEKYGITLSKSHLSQYVNGKSEPDQHKLFILAETLNVNEAWLMGYDVERDKNVDKYDEESDQTPEFYAIQRNSKKLTQKEQQKLLKIMKATFDKLSSIEDDDSDDYL